MEIKIAIAQKVPLKKQDKSYFSHRLTFPSEFIDKNIKNNENDSFFVIANISKSINLIRLVGDAEISKMKKEEKEEDKEKTSKVVLQSNIVKITQEMLNETSEYLNQNKVQIIELQNPSKPREIVQGKIDIKKIEEVIDGIDGARDSYSDIIDKMLKKIEKKEEITKDDIEYLKETLNEGLLDGLIVSIRKLGD